MAGRGYGTSDYGQSLYGQTLYLDGVATVSATATPSASANRVRIADSSVGAIASVSSPTGEFMIDASANTIQGSATTASAAVEVFDGLASGGGSAVGSTATGTRVREVSAPSSASASATASLQFITNASASVSASASNTAACERVRLVSKQIDGQSAFSASGNITAVGSASSSGTASIVVDFIRERSVAANTVQTVSTFASVDGREKWEPVSATSMTYDTIPETSITWSKIAA